MRAWVAAAALSSLNLASIHQALSAPPDPWKALEFLQGTWEAHAQAGSAGAKAAGTYTFKLELKRHVLARHSVPTACQGPKSFNCDHSDLFYVYQEAEGQPLKAVYFDDEGHVIYYSVSTPDATTAIFVSDALRAGPQFQLIYQLRDAVMSGKFQVRMPGRQEWNSYLEWSGSRNGTGSAAQIH